MSLPVSEISEESLAFVNHPLVLVELATHIVDHERNYPTDHLVAFVLGWILHHQRRMA